MTYHHDLTVFFFVGALDLGNQVIGIAAAHAELRLPDLVAHAFEYLLAMVNRLLSRSDVGVSGFEVDQVVEIAHEDLHV